MQIRKVLHHTFNAAASFVGAAATAICAPLFVLSLLGFPNGPSSRHDDEVLKYGAGTAAGGALFAAGYKRSFLKDKKNAPKQ